MYLSGSQKTHPRLNDRYGLLKSPWSEPPKTTSNNAMRHIRETSAIILLHIIMMHEHALGIRFRT